MACSTHTITHTKGLEHSGSLGATIVIHVNMCHAVQHHAVSVSNCTFLNYRDRDSGVN